MSGFLCVVCNAHNIIEQGTNNAAAHLDKESGSGRQMHVLSQLKVFRQNLSHLQCVVCIALLEVSIAKIEKAV